MTYQHASFTARRQARWMRPDAARFLRPDAAKFLKSGNNPADAFPALARRRDAIRKRDDRQRAETIARERLVLDNMRRDLARIKSDLAWRRILRALTQKYSDSQPRVPAGSGRESGRWTSGGEGSSGRPRVYIYGTKPDDESAGNGGQLDEIVVDGADVNPGFDGPAGEADAPNSTDDVNIGNSNDSSSRIADPRVLSDAEPDAVRPGEQYAQLNKITDAAGNPYYEPGGHHEMAKGVYQKWNLQPDTRKIFDDSTTGTLPKGTVRFDPDGIPYANRWGGPKSPHAEYNNAISELSENYLQQNDLRPENMTPRQAEDLLKEIRESEDPRIRDFNRAMRMLRRVFRFRFGRSE